MTKLKLAVVAASVSVFSVFGLSGPAHAWNCNGLDNADVKLSPACAAAATVICKVLAKGEPCLA
jgi:hypothetical protein